ncbi:hypothetical protein IEQ34_007334 [Dendrobium chrysotoxum]|uniref:Uncharacterized protein n=1 Tax=Dendrobium chrysotoxum TaxID=161865 RepID=A0AAV7H973_DENCH|nr:hypothetical protein IEQ34_007334 [Dendrobium chrysotoxum]
MEHPQQTSKYAVAHDSNLHLFIGSPSYIDPDIMELQSSSLSISLSTTQKRKRSQVYASRLSLYLLPWASHNLIDLSS